MTGRNPIAQCVVASLILIPATGLQAATLIVPDDFPTIQAAIDAAAAGDTVLIEPNTYAESITLKSDIAVRGREAARTLLGPTPNDTGPTVTIQNVSNVFLGNLTIVNSTIGIDVTISSNVRISSTVLDSVTLVALTVDVFSDVNIINNTFWNNTIAVERGTPDAQITNNIFSTNTVTITSPLPLPIDSNVNVNFNCFFNNEDLQLVGVDTGLGDNFQIGIPAFVDQPVRDFHLMQGSVCIDAGLGLDVIDDSVADMGAYGGAFADAFPYPVPEPVAVDSSAATPPPYNIDIGWEPNLAYLVTNTSNPGGYRVYYQQNASGPPYNGVDAGGGTLPSPIDVGIVTSYTLANLNPQVATPEAPILLTADPRNGGAALTWSAVSEAEGYSVTYGVNAVDENTTDVGNVTSFTVTGLVNGTTYRFAVTASRQPTYFLSVTVLDSTPDKNESVFSDETSVPLGDPTQSASSNELTAVPQATAPYPALANEGCFIATAAFGSEWTTELRLLRQFRDRFLLTNAAGRGFVRWYYANSPPAARWLNSHADLKPVVRWALMPLVTLAALLLTDAWVTKAMLVAALVAGASWVLWRRRPRARDRRAVQAS
ncbi:MAG: CFI-box-CTERM domain-containing protein [Gammaproteobacteria bacterium]